MSRIPKDNSSPFYYGQYQKKRKYQVELKQTQRQHGAASRICAAQHSFRATATMIISRIESRPCSKSKPTGKNGHAQKLRTA